MSNDVETRRRRAQWRAAHRGTKEMDLLLGRYAEAVLPGMSEAALGEFETFLQLGDPQLQIWILNGTAIQGSPFGPLVDAVRAFHGLGGTSGA